MPLRGAQHPAGAESLEARGHRAGEARSQHLWPKSLFFHTKAWGEAYLSSRTHGEAQRIPSGRHATERGGQVPGAEEESLQRRAVSAAAHAWRASDICPFE